MIMLAVAMIVGCGTALAQNNSKKQRISREELADKQAHYIADQLALDNATTTKFVETYKQCQKEIWALGPRKRQATGGNDAETEQEIKERFAHSQKILDIRQTYYEKYSKFLTQRQIKRVYELERQMMKRLAKRSGGANTSHSR